MMRRLAVLLLLLALARGAAAGEPDSREADKQRARALLGQGITAEDRGNLEGALEHYREALAAFPSPLLWLNIANVLSKRGRDAEAAQAYDRFLSGVASTPEVSDRKIQGARDALSQLIKRVGRLEVSAEVPPRALHL